MFNRKKHEIEMLREANKDLLCKYRTATKTTSHEVAELYDRLFEEREACAGLKSENEKLRQLLAAANDQAAQAEAEKASAAGRKPHAAGEDRRGAAALHMPGGLRTPDESERLPDVHPVPESARQVRGDDMNESRAGRFSEKRITAYIARYRSCTRFESIPAESLRAKRLQKSTRTS